MPRLKAWGQGSEAPAHLQLRHGPTGASVGQSRYTCVADLVVAEFKLLRMAHMAHQTKLSDQENTHAKAQGMSPRQ